VSNLQRLLDMYREDERTQSIINVLDQEAPSRILLENMVGAMDGFVLIGTYQERSHHNHFFIASDKEEAAYFQNTLDQLQDVKPVLFFLDSFKRPMSFEKLDTNNALQRTEAINKISLGLPKGEIVVTYPEAIFEKVVDPSLLEKDKIEIVKGENLDIDTIVELLVEYSFERTEFVYEPGQFSIRGGIVDIFSFGNEWPYRVELFDEEVESIRTFNPTTQLSLRKISKISIIPDVNRKFESEDKISIFKVFDQNTCVWIKDLDMLLDRLQMCFEKAEEFAKTLRNLILIRTFLY